MYSGTSDEMSLEERALNAVIVLTASLAQRLYYERRDQAHIDKAFGPGQPAVGELARNTSLLLSNTFHALSLPRPLATNVVEVGGIHIAGTVPKPLPLVSFGPRAGRIRVGRGPSRLHATKYYVFSNPRNS